MTLKPEWMGLALLAVSWTTALMVALDALIDVRRIRALMASWRSSLVSGVVTSAELGALAIEQRVKHLDDGGLGFFERGHVSAVAGTAQVGGEVLEVAGAPDVEVWPTPVALAEAARCASPAAFDALAAQVKGRGALRTVRVALEAGQPVWLAGARDGGRFVATLAAGFDPRDWARSRLALNFGLIALDLLWVALGTALALTAPVFGPWSIAGAVVLVGHFLGVTPLAVQVREKSKTPAKAALLGEWKRPSDGDVGAPAPVAR
jgi:hypothetical protein